MKNMVMGDCQSDVVRYISKTDRNHYTMMLEILLALDVPSDYKWLITDVEAYPNDDSLARKFESPLIISNRELIEMLKRDDFQWIWSVFSLFHPKIDDVDILKEEPLLYSKIETELYEKPVIQHSLSILEIDAFDSSYVMLTSKDKNYSNRFKELFPESEMQTASKVNGSTNENTKKIEMIGYNDTKAIAMYGCIKMTPICVASLIIACFCLIPAFVFTVYELLFLFLIPALLFLFMILQYVVNSRYKTFLKGLKVKHKFSLCDSKLFKDGREVKSVEDIRLYKFKKFIFLELKQSYYRIMNDDYSSGSREEFLSRLRFYPRHHVAFVLPPKTEDDWRLSQGNFDDIKNHAFKKQYFHTKEDNDHEHCCFCWKKITDLDIDEEHDSIGYVTIDKHGHEEWVCEECFEDFKTRFNFKSDNDG